MARVLIPYGTTEGQTAKIADVIADVIRDRGHTADAVDINGPSNKAPAGYDAVIVGASIHMGKHDKHVVEFVQKNHDTLDQLPSAFFSVSLAAHGGADDARAQARHLGAATQTSRCVPRLQAGPAAGPDLRVRANSSP